ncbi:MAG: flagellar hook-basal body complex protein FliE [Euryarchaeota archaeon]|nr:flagellar hook-basal body complex protein FliE [Euryarchaeota archaeon]
MLIIGFVGYPGSGKSEATATTQALGFDVVSMGDTVRRYMHEHGAELSEHNVGATANELRHHRGMDAVARMCIPPIHSSKSNKIVIDGIRGIAEVKAFKKEFNDQFKLIAIVSSPETRFNRVRNRNRSDDVHDLRAFKQKDSRELAWGLKDALEAADYCLSNEGNIDEFRSAVASLLAQLVRSSSYAMHVTICAPIHETESAHKVAMAVRNVFPDAALECSNDTLNGTSESLQTFALLLKQQRIRSTAKNELLQRATPTSFEFSLNKQAACINKVNFGSGPLGSIYVKVLTSSSEQLINMITDESE